jgi:hypothetical protein
VRHLSATKCLQWRREECEGREPLRVFRQLDREDMEKWLTPPPGEPEGVQPTQWCFIHSSPRSLSGQLITPAPGMC